MKVGDKIRVFTYCMGHETGTVDHTIEEFRYCLGFFQSKDHRKASEFTPLCVLYERGPDSENDYISNYGEYYTNPVQAWMNLP